MAMDDDEPIDEFGRCGSAPATFAQVFLKQTRSRAIVAGNNIGDRGTAALAAAVQTNPNLTALNLCSELCRA